MRTAQLDELGFFEKRALRTVVAQSRAVAQAQRQKVEVAERVTLDEAVSHAIEHVFTRQSVAPEHALLEAALVKGCGQLELSALKRDLAARPELVHVGAEYSTRAILHAELTMIRSVNDGLNAVTPLAPRFEVDKKLGADQRAALGLVLSSCDRITGMQGLAGAGKTTALRELHAAVKASGRELIVCAPSAAATDVLRKESFAAAVTVAKLLTRHPPLSPRAVLVVDEAGTLGTADMVKLFNAAKEAGARVVLVGDTGQHAPVAQGDALRILENHSGYRFGQLTQIRRQRSEELKETVALAAKQQTGEAFSRLLKAGEVVEHADPAALHQKAATAYLQATAQGRDTLLVSPTWAEIAAVTAAVRTQLRKDGRLAGEETIKVFDPLGWTDAQKKLVAHYEPGLHLRFVKPTEHFKAGEFAEVLGRKGKQLLVRRSDDAKTGAGFAWAPSRSPSSFEVGQKRDLAVAAGDVLLLRANAQNFVNGERVTVKAMQGGKISLVDGRALPADYRTFTHGYAVTSHAAQGKTVDEVLVVASSRSFAAVSQEQFYVSISRARERARVFTDDAGLLRQRVQDTHTRKAAVELAGLREALGKAGFKRAPSLTPAALRVTAQEPAPRRVWRQLRALRVERLAPALRVAQWTHSVRQWLGERLGLAERLRQPLAARQQLTNPIPLVQRPDSPRQSRGMRI